MASELDWLIIRDDFDNKEIGAIGFADNKAAVIVSFYDDADGNRDGKVSIGEFIASKISPIGIKGMAVTEVAMTARNDLDVYEKDPSFNQEAARIFVNFATSMVFDGIYAVYFSRGISKLASSAAAGATNGLVKQFVVRKGMEKTVKAIYDAAVKNRDAFTR